MIDLRRESRQLPEPVHRPVAGGAQAELRIVQQRAKSGGRSVNERLRDVRIVVGDQRDVHDVGDAAVGEGQGRL